MNDLATDTNAKYPCPSYELKPVLCHVFRSNTNLDRLLYPTFLPESIVRYVARTLEPVVRADAARDGLFTQDPHILAGQAELTRNLVTRALGEERQREDRAGARSEMLEAFPKSSSIERHVVDPRHVVERGTEAREERRASPLTAFP